MEFIFNVKEVQVLARQHARGWEKGWNDSLEENLYHVLKEMSGCRKDPDCGIPGQPLNVSKYLPTGGKVRISA